MASFFWSNMMKKGGGGEKDGGKLSSSRSSTPRVGKAVSAENASKDISESRDMYRNHREQTLKDYQIMIEYKHLKQHVPPGVYVLPSFENMRKWCGVIFLRAGFWKTGVFRFSIEMPPNYPGDGARPTIKFLNQVFHPLVDYRTGEVDLATRFPNWVGGEHYVLFCLKYLKQMFYLPQASNGDGKFILQMITEGRTKNDEATRLWLTEKKRFMEMHLQRMMETRVFYQWLKKFYISRHPHHHHERTCRRNPLSRYNVHERRKQCKNGPDFENLIRSNRKKNATTSMPTVQVDHTTYSQIDRRSNVVWNPIKKKRKRGREVLRELDGLENMSLETPPKRLRKRRFYGDEKSTQLMQTPLSRFISQCSEKARRKEGRCSTNQLSQ